MSRNALQQTVQEQAGFLWRLVRQDIGRKVTALGLALLLWGWMWWLVVDKGELDFDVVTVASRAQADALAQRDSGIYVVVPPDLIVREINPPRIDGDFRGAKDDIATLHLYAIFELEKLRDALAGKDEATLPLVLEQKKFRSPRTQQPDLQEFELSRDSVQVTVARKETLSNFPLSAQNAAVTGVPAEGHQFVATRIRVVPNSVTVSGPRAALERLREHPEELRLVPVDVAGKVHEVIQKVGLDTRTVDPLVRLEVPGNVVDVAVPIEPRPETLDLPLVEVVYLHEDTLASAGLRVAEATRQIDLQLVGPRSLLSEGAAVLRRRIRLVVDWAEVGTELARGTLKPLVLRTGVPEESVTIAGADGRDPEIEFELVPIASGAAKDGAPDS